MTNSRRRNVVNKDRTKLQRLLSYFVMWFLPNEAMLRFFYKQRVDCARLMAVYKFMGPQNNRHNVAIEHDIIAKNFNKVRPWFFKDIETIYVYIP